MADHTDQLRQLTEKLTAATHGDAPAAATVDTEAVLRAELREARAELADVRQQLAELRVQIENGEV